MLSTSPKLLETLAIPSTSSRAAQPRFFKAPEQARVPRHYQGKPTKRGAGERASRHNHVFLPEVLYGSLADLRGQQIEIRPFLEAGADRGSALIDRGT